MPAVAWNMEVFAAIEWRRFEAVCEALFAQAGLRRMPNRIGGRWWRGHLAAQPQQPGPGGGGAMQALAEQTRGRARAARVLWGDGVAQAQARHVCHHVHLHARGPWRLRGPTAFTRWTAPGCCNSSAAARLRSSRNCCKWLYEGEYWRPTCASCGTKMVERSRSSDGGLFWAAPTTRAASARCPRPRAVSY